MKSLGAGVVLATLAMYIFGFAYWAANPLPYAAWKRSTDDTAAGRALLNHFPENGTYMIPGVYNDPKELPSMYERGPVAFVHMLNRDGRPQVDPTTMVLGFILNLLVVILLAALLKKVGPSLTTYRSRVGFILLAGVTASVMIDGGDSVWWSISAAWKIHQAIYNICAWTIAGVVLAGFVRADT